MKELHIKEDTLLEWLRQRLVKLVKVAYLASFPIPELIRDINAVALGMQSVNPDATLNSSLVVFMV